MATYYDDERNIIKLLGASSKINLKIFSKGFLGNLRTWSILRKVTTEMFFDI